MPPPHRSPTASVLAAQYMPSLALVMRAARFAQAPLQNWLLGMNPYLDDEAPALHIVDQPRAVLRAARAFAAVG